MLYKVTPMMVPVAPEKKEAREPGQPRKRRKSSVYDADGHEVLISLMCLKCKTLKPLAQFGLRKMADGAIRNQPWCRGCRSGAGTKKPKKDESQTVTVTVSVPAVAAEPVLQVVAAVPLDAAPVAPTLVDAPVAVDVTAPAQV
ncbi:hypothetical protein KH5H1_39940 [Corallococcus caeni]|uniref:Uncharacterized protein n=1 Tax=Corallococcus caeni TaxID=3082388 RepID=A0ABQ6QYC0_9BACT|nr:hypothetical protein KH5H1_39940 [Corallococcus sp. KH5-1]GMU09027.1 hypothetical protein ASNO1_52800 [Corallococcus sp. NO1]